MSCRRRGSCRSPTGPRGPGDGAARASSAAILNADGTPGDRIQLRGLRVNGTHGVLPEERKRPQPFEVDLDLSVDLAAAGASDLLADTVDYGEIAATVVSIVAGSPSYRLLEALATAIAAATLAGDDRIDGVSVNLRKLQPPLDVDIATVGVHVNRHR